MTTTITTPTTQSITTQKTDVIAEYQALIDNMDTLLPDIDPFVLDGVTVARAALKATLKARIDAAAKLKADRKTVAADVAAEHVAIANAEPLRKAIKGLCLARFGATSPILQQLGFVPHRERKVKAVNKATGVTKARKTRAATGPKGKQQRAAKKAAAAAQPQANGGNGAGGAGGNGQGGAS